MSGGRQKDLFKSSSGFATYSFLIGKKKEEDEKELFGRESRKCENSIIKTGKLEKYGGKSSKQMGPGGENNER
jgi:hypothetical protein